MKVYVLLSGGIDSMACIHFYLSLGYDVKCIFCNYGQPSLIRERSAALTIAEFFNVPLEIISIQHIDIPAFGEICGRNALLIFAAFSKIQYGSYKIALGIHSGSTYSDCSQAFINSINNVLDIYTNGKVITEAPFILWDKADIINYCQIKALPLNLTYSCEVGSFPPCGTCYSCKDRKELLNE